ncbi:heat-shock protein Hsp20 [Tripterygium wilfordii]|uniref:Heat-shock protein Hsp20 n=1 Tax=Tripterygium wilfordii TaxID=458696 RepID=A0A7J7CM88_TRIWF|nr:heat-shock protein Hsp20 [Tripterygium wilfordii]
MSTDRINEILSRVRSQQDSLLSRIEDRMAMPLPFEIKHTPEGCEITLNYPNFSKQDFQVENKNGILQVIGNNSQEKEENKDGTSIMKSMINNKFIGISPGHGNARITEENGSVKIFFPKRA